MPKSRLIESDGFPFEFISQLAERESWRKEIHRPIYHVHKWWAKRLGSVFRGILLGCVLPENGDLATAFYQSHSFWPQTVFDPFMGSGTTLGEAHKLGFTALGRDINPVAVEAVATALGPMDRRSLLEAFEELSDGVGKTIRSLYRSQDSRGSECDVLYYFWVMRVACPECDRSMDLFRSYVLGQHAYPDRKPDVQLVCPSCGDIFLGTHGQTRAICRSCAMVFDPTSGSVKGAKALCRDCGCRFPVIHAVTRQNVRPEFRLYGKLVLAGAERKEYLPATKADRSRYEWCSAQLSSQLSEGAIALPNLELENGYNTRQALSYAFRSWRDFFNDRQLLALSWLRNGILRIADEPARSAMLTLFSGVLEFNNLFASYKGEGTGAVRHMFSHHILKPERTPIEANVWGTPKSSGSFSNLFRRRLLRAIEYRLNPTEVDGKSKPGRVCSPPFSGLLQPAWPRGGEFAARGIYVTCGDSADTGLPDASIDLVVTDPPFFDNVHYSELADFFFAWQQLGRDLPDTTRSRFEVQDSDAKRFAEKLQAVFRECGRLLTADGLLVFTYHHSRDEGWRSLAEAVLGAGFAVLNSQPVKAEMSVATPKAQAKEPIQLDIILVCRKQVGDAPHAAAGVPEALQSARAKLRRLHRHGLRLSRNDRKIVLYGQLLTTLCGASDVERFAELIEAELVRVEPEEPMSRRQPEQRLLF